jgi:pyridoxamine 5'-phosphate oxidase
MKRSDYSLDKLVRSEFNSDPIVQFKVWFDKALQTNMPEPTAMNLATCDKAGRVSSRIVLLKSYDERGFMFFTNYESYKAAHLENNPSAALCFWWGMLERQVRIEGTVEKVSASESDEYFASRPRRSQIGAIASQQSSVIDSYQVLAEQVESIEQQFETAEAIPRPEFWGGYLLRPESIEFWQGRPNRLHDRLKYKKTVDGDWTIDRLSP